MYSNNYSPFLLPLLVSFAVQGSAKLLLETIPTFPELSQLQGYINKFPRLSAELTNVDNYTFLAPTNDAFDSWLSAATPKPTLDDIEATLFYHLLHGIHPIASFTPALQFVPSFLNNDSYTNVTAGQSVQLSLSSSKLPIIGSGNMTKSELTTTDIVATGGLVHIVSSVLQIPEREPIVVRDAKLSFFIAMLSRGGFLSAERDDFTTKITDLPDSVYFAPNTAEALSHFQSIATMTTDRLTDLLEYHVVSNNLLYSSDLRDGMNLTTLHGSNLTIRVGEDGTKFVNGARILRTDFLIANGVLHTIDSFLDPANITTPDIPVSSHRLGAPAVAGIVTSVVILVLLAIGIAFLLLRRKGKNFQLSKLRAPISYPSYTRSRHELGSRDTAEMGIWVAPTDDGGAKMDKKRGVNVHAVELDAARTRAQVWELESPEENRADRGEKSEEWERYPAEKYRDRRGN